ncbi:MAG: hypothetical protein V3R77_01750 [Candidatus Binatia bacterium]
MPLGSGRGSGCAPRSLEGRAGKKSVSIAVAVHKSGKTVIAADSLSVFGDRKVPIDNHRASKIMAIGNARVGMAGWGLYDNVLVDFLSRGKPPALGNEKQIYSFFLKLWSQLRERYTLVNEQPHPDDESPFADIDSSFLIASPGGIFHVSGNLSVTRFEKYYAIGTGGDYALGSLFTLYDGKLDAATLAVKACKTAIAFDVSCGGEIDVYDV